MTNFELVTGKDCRYPFLSDALAHVLPAVKEPEFSCNDTVNVLNFHLVSAGQGRSRSSLRLFVLNTLICCHHSEQRINCVRTVGQNDM